eukprot:CAMPEP_0119005676 /NCGR_PEP_ID=MMETSP1176-20130426/1861_1 /TAXON_ID=265551 /ORGANISM="Synedropsis recta cf, Strain CCMP1620" /LENGTH=573 /DNA_ID=CAMNT_0006957513 /DNA_START=29 /DNA_END=1750 /DNA_ORIENTATION=-
MNRQLGGKAESSEASPLSLLVHAADSQRSSGKNGGQGKPGENGSGHGQRDAPGARIPEGAPSSSLEDHMAQRQAAARAEALHHHGLLSQLRAGTLGAGSLGENEFFQQNAALVAAQQQQQAAALALASDIRTAVAAAQLRQHAQFQNQDLMLARNATLQQLGLGGGGGGVEQLQQELELHRLEEMERRQLMAAAAAGGPMGNLNARQQLELQEAQIRQEQYDRQMGGGGGGESLLDRAGLRAPMDNGGRGPANDAGSKDSFQKTAGSVVVPCRARGMPMDHNFKTAYFVIPENVEHGEELICSYFACRNAGIKFRYCTHCKVPVAKRNFRKRHKHGKTSAGADGEEEEEVEEEEDASAKAAKNLEVVKKASVQRVPPTPAFDIPKKMEIPTPKAPENKMKSKPVAPPAPPADDVDGPSLPPISHQARPKISQERERLWGQLLAKRPPTKDGEAVSAWLMEVLSVSDLDTPLKENGQVSASAGMALPSAHLAAASKDAAAMLIKKKRPLAVLQKEDSCSGSGSDKEPPSSAKDDEEDGETPSKKDKKDVGSFAEWKDRKKHKGLPKKGFSMQSE